jgi:hypothetical protein
MKAYRGLDVWIHVFLPSAIVLHNLRRFCSHFNAIVQ